MVSRHMCCGILDDKLMARVGPEQYEDFLKKDCTNKIDFTGSPMKGMIYVEPDGLKSNEELTFWVDRCMDFINTLPPKK